MSRPVVSVVAAVIKSDDRYLITQRSANAVLPLLWEFPGGRVEEGESLAQALEREVTFRIGAHIQVGELLAEHTHAYSSYDVHMRMFACELTGSRLPYPATVHDMRWVSSREFVDYNFPPADEASMSKLLGLFGN